MYLSQAKFTRDGLAHLPPALRTFFVHDLGLAQWPRARYAKKQGGSGPLLHESRNITLQTGQQLTVPTFLPYPNTANPRKSVGVVGNVVRVK